MPDYGPITYEDRRKVMGGYSDLAGTPDGLAGPATATLNFIYYMTVDDAVVLLDPNATYDEKLIAGFFLIPTPLKFGKPLLKNMDDVGGAVNAWRKGNKPVNLPSYKKVEIDMEHVLSGHMKAGQRATQSD